MHEKYKDFNPSLIKLTNIYRNNYYFNTNYNLSLYTTTLLECDKIVDILGGPVLFPSLPTDLPYILSSFVSSIDGKILYPDNHNGNLVANNNFLDKHGGVADFWIMNMLRAFCDAIIIGGKTLTDNPNLTGSIYDKDLDTARQKFKKHNPIIIIPTLHGNSIPFNHAIFDYKTKNDNNGMDYIYTPIIILATKQALKNIIKFNPNNEIANRQYIILDIEQKQVYESDILINIYNQLHNGKIIIIVSNNLDIDNMRVFKLLKLLSIDVISVESATYFHQLIIDKLINEIFLNYCGVYIGGNSLSIGGNGKSFTSLIHPHLEILELYIHKNNFLYTRQKIVY